MFCWPLEPLLVSEEVMRGKQWVQLWSEWMGLDNIKTWKTKWSSYGWQSMGRRTNFILPSIVITPGNHSTGIIITDIIFPWLLMINNSNHDNIHLSQRISHINYYVNIPRPTPTMHCKSQCCVHRTNRASFFNDFGHGRSLLPTSDVWLLIRRMVIAEGGTKVILFIPV